MRGPVHLLSCGARLFGSTDQARALKSGSWMSCSRAATLFSFIHSLKISTGNTFFLSSDRSPCSSTGCSLGGSTCTSMATETGGMAVMGSSESRETVDRTKDAVHSTVDRLAGTACDWAGRLDERTQGLSDMPNRALDYSRHTLQERPMQVILLSMLVGYVIGRFSGGRRTHYVEY